MHSLWCEVQVALGILKRSGYSEVTTVVDGQQAMDELHRRGGADAFDIILTDLHMPHKVNSTQLTSDDIISSTQSTSFLQIFLRPTR